MTPNKALKPALKKNARRLDQCTRQSRLSFIDITPHARSRGLRPVQANTLFVALFVAVVSLRIWCQCPHSGSNPSISSRKLCITTFRNYASGPYAPLCRCVKGPCRLQTCNILAKIRTLSTLLGGKGCTPSIN